MKMSTKFFKFKILNLLILSGFCIQAIAGPASRAIHNFANKTLAARDDSSGYITAISLTSQCGTKQPVDLAVGHRAIGDLTPINKNSLFQSGSITKSFISVVILQLSKERGFSIDSTEILDKYLPEYPKWRHITPRQLMNMTSGIPGNGNKLADDIFRQFTADEYHHYISPKRILDLTHSLPLHFKPGSSFEYSNSNYTVLGMLIERITQHSPEFEVKKRIIDKLSLSRTYFPSDTLQAMTEVNPEDIVHGYAFFSEEYDPYPFMIYGEDTTDYSLSESNSSGAIVSTTSDINRFIHALFTAGALLSKSQLNTLQSMVSRTTGQPLTPAPGTERMAYGLGIIGYYSQPLNHLIYVYNGETNGFNFAYLYDPNTQLSLTFAVNSIAKVVGMDDGLNLFYRLNSMFISTEKAL